MPMKAFFLNHSVFDAKDGKKTYRKLTCCDEKGEVLEFFHDDNIAIPENIPLFSPLTLTVSVQNTGKSIRLKLDGLQVETAKGVK